MVNHDGKNIALVFPGQGAQYVGMGKTLADKYPSVLEIFEKTDAILGFSLSGIIFNGPETELTLTKNSQPAIYATSWACLTVLREQCPDLKPAFHAGLSLGEYTAHAASGSFGFEGGLRLVRKRGELMQEAGERNAGTMASVMGLAQDKLEEICRDVSQRHPVNIANMNSPGQIVISGSIEGVKEASAKSLEAGAKRSIELKVSGAFHSTLMNHAGEALREYLAGVDIKTPGTPVVSNVTAEPVSGPGQIRETLASQVTSPVLWQQSIEYMARQGVKVFVECGCGKVLRGLIKRIIPDAVTFGVEDPDSLEETISAL